MIDAAEIIRSGTSILFVTLDSLRHDVARATTHAGQTPRLAAFLPGGQWEERRALGTFTLPAHIAFFSGFLPKLPQPVQPPRLWECRPPAFKTIDPGTFVFDASNLLEGLVQHGYRTVCVGGVTYFSRETPLGSVLPDMFQEDHWRPEFCSHELDSTRHQVDQTLEVADRYDDRPCSFSSTSAPPTSPTATTSTNRPIRGGPRARPWLTRTNTSGGSSTALSAVAGGWSSCAPTMATPSERTATTGAESPTLL
ncbi:hypothetical protein [Streptomyces sp. NPDC005408]|uniref:hypothetical protein n=1 Tax=Streptomyces sp. NPDC005408 TaxID=3155341 RepID=UPI0033AAF9D6